MAALMTGSQKLHLRTKGGKHQGTAYVQSLARLAGFEPATLGLEVRCSIQLSYRRSGLAD